MNEQDNGHAIKFIWIILQIAIKLYFHRSMMRMCTEFTWKSWVHNSLSSTKKELQFQTEFQWKNLFPFYTIIQWKKCQHSSLRLNWNGNYLKSRYIIDFPLHLIIMHHACIGRHWILSSFDDYLLVEWESLNVWSGHHLNSIAFDTIHVLFHFHKKGRVLRHPINKQRNKRLAHSFWTVLYTNIEQTQPPENWKSQIKTVA